MNIYLRHFLKTFILKYIFLIFKQRCNSSALHIKQIFMILQQRWPLLQLTCSRHK